jgi:predicted permease
MGVLWKRLAALFRGKKLDNELNAEIEAHLAMQEEEFRRAGMTPGEARLAARREFGGVAQTLEAYRERRGVPWLESPAKDIRYALRGLARSPGFAAAAILSLALGIGANTAIFSLVHTVMLRSLPVAHPEELVTMYRTGGWGTGGISSYPFCLALRERADLFRDVAAEQAPYKVRFRVNSRDHIEMAAREYVSGNYFSLLGVRPLLGRVFTDDDNRAAQGSPLVVLSYDFWHNRFGGDPGMIGRTVFVSDQPMTVIGVAAPGFRGVQVEWHTDLWIPLVMGATSKSLMDEGMHWLRPIARLAPGISRERAETAVGAIWQRHLERHYGNYPNAAFKRRALDQRMELRDAAGGFSMLREQFGKPLLVLMAAVGLVLLVACTNLANLLLARGAARRKEIALRYSLGATRGRLIRQHLTESLLLGAAGCAMGALFASWGEAYVLKFIPMGFGVEFSTTPDRAVLAFTAAVSLAAAILFGLIPAWRSTAIDPAAGLQSRGSSAAGSAALRRVLVVTQVAFSTVLVVMAGLFAHSLAELRAIDPGFRNQNVVSTQLDFPRSWKPEQRRAARERLMVQTETLPGVLSVSDAFPGPFKEGAADITLRVPGSQATAREPGSVAIQYAAARFFETIGSRPITGRDFDRNDTATSRKVAIVNEAFARRYFPEAPNPVGRIVSFDDSKPEGGEPTYVVGLVRDMTQQGLRRAPWPTIYVPITQLEPGWDPSILVRAQLPPAELTAALRREVSKLGPEVALTEPATLRQKMDDDIYQDRLLATLSGFFGILALALAAIGLYGVVAYSTAQRGFEIGIRIALGARRSGVLWMVLRDALLLVALGLAVGLPASLLAAATVESVLFEVKPADPLTFLTTACVLAGIALAAAFLPARRAATIDPLKVLRQE